MALQTRIERKLRELKPLYGLAGWEHKIVFHEKQPDDDDGLGFEEQCALSVECFPKYLRFHLNVYPKFAVRIKERAYNFDLYLMHELGHVLLSEYDKLLDDVLSSTDEFLHTSISERTTEMIARAIMRASGKFTLDF